MHKSGQPQVQRGCIDAAKQVDPPGAPGADWYAVPGCSASQSTPLSRPDRRIVVLVTEVFVGAYARAPRPALREATVDYSFLVKRTPLSSIV